MRAVILNKTYIHLLPIPKQLFSKYYFAVYCNKLWRNWLLLAGLNIWRTLYVKIVINSWILAAYLDFLENSNEFEQKSLKNSFKNPKISGFDNRFWNDKSTDCYSKRSVLSSVIHFFIKQLPHQKLQWNIVDNVLPHKSWKFHANIWSISKVINKSCFLSFQKKLPIVVRSNWRHCRQKSAKIILKICWIFFI